MAVFVHKDICKKTIDHHGEKETLIITMEECAELQQAVSKTLRKEELAMDPNLLEEIADVLICIEDLKLIFGITDEKLQEEVQKKEWRNFMRIRFEDSEEPH